MNPNWSWRCIREAGRWDRVAMTYLGSGGVSSRNDQRSDWVGCGQVASVVCGFNWRQRIQWIHVPAKASNVSGQTLTVISRRSGEECLPVLSTATTIYSLRQGRRPETQQTGMPLTRTMTVSKQRHLEWLRNQQENMLRNVHLSINMFRASFSV